MEIIIGLLALTNLFMICAWEKAVSQRNYFRRHAEAYWEELQHGQKDGADWWKEE